MVTLSGLFLLASLQYGLPPDLLKSVCWVESHHQATAIHKDDGGQDSIGICQLHYSTARLMGFKGKPKDLLDPKINIYVAAKYLSHLQTRYQGNITRALIAYNQGSAKQLTRTIYSDKVLSVWRSKNGKRCE